MSNLSNVARSLFAKREVVVPIRPISALIVSALAVAGSVGSIVGLFGGPRMGGSVAMGVAMIDNAVGDFRAEQTPNSTNKSFLSQKVSAAARFCLGGACTAFFLYAPFGAAKLTYRSMQHVILPAVRQALKGG